MVDVSKAAAAAAAAPPPPPPPPAPTAPAGPTPTAIMSSRDIGQYCSTESVRPVVPLASLKSIVKGCEVRLVKMTAADYARHNMPRPAPEEKEEDKEDKCSVCLGEMDNKSITDSCNHCFCFVCIKEWSTVKAVCPLCRGKFSSILYNIVSPTEHDTYLVVNNSPMVIIHDIRAVFDDSDDE